MMRLQGLSCLLQAELSLFWGVIAMDGLRLVAFFWDSFVKPMVEDQGQEEEAEMLPCLWLQKDRLCVRTPWIQETCLFMDLAESK